ncbi:lysozyme inhibitor LprI family protein [Sphingomonas sp.]|jgi:uncharacterized protein YecT (DUF1311 family)|uniref:lysozyme inhibitor LprI family protein n=1 Tax=Sphingomonas sp. TaxID=28214 RepID=UPI002E33FFB8|nr:lysozyme inhibitor LprI family protein [Sphingomonas sp.]HEX4694312.1 lysozyme inhibitor LprI family protein [Sphingomonas sp.]
MKFDPNHPAIKKAQQCVSDSRANVSDQTKFGAIRTFGEKLSDAIGEYQGRPRKRNFGNLEKQQDYLIALREAGILSISEYDDFDTVREIGNKGAHGDEIFSRSRQRALDAFNRLLNAFQSSSSSQSKPPLHADPKHSGKSSQSSFTSPPKPAPSVIHFPSPPPKPTPPAEVPFRSSRPRPDPDFHPWQWVGGIVGLLVIVSIVRSCVAGLTSTFSPTPQPPQAVVSSFADAPTTAAPTYYETSFNCDRARGWAEQQICSTSSLADSDRRQAALYSSAMARAGGADRADLRQSQRNWLAVRNGCGDVSCIEQAYTDRIGILESWAPTPVPADGGSQDAQPQPPHGEVRADPPTGAITCILPYGQEMQATKTECERLGGSVYN